MSSAAPTPAATKYVTGTLDHVALDVTSVAATLPFYTDVLGLEPLRLAEYNGGSVPFPSVRISPDTILDFFEAPAGAPVAARPAGAAGHLCLCLDRASWEAVRGRVRDAGLPAGEVRQLSGARGMGTSVYLTDPEQNKVEIRYYA